MFLCQLPAEMTIHDTGLIQANDATRQLPVFVGHGSADPLVPATLATRTVDGLKASGDIEPVPWHDTANCTLRRR